MSSQLDKSRCSPRRFIPKCYTRTFLDTMRQTCMLPNVMPPRGVLSHYPVFPQKTQERSGDVRYFTSHYRDAEYYLRKAAKNGARHITHHENEILHRRAALEVKARHAAEIKDHKANKPEGTQ